MIQNNSYDILTQFRQIFSFMQCLSKKDSVHILIIVHLKCNNKLGAMETKLIISFQKLLLFHHNKKLF